MYTACIYKYFQIAAESFPRKQIFSTHSDYRKDRKKKLLKGVHAAVVSIC